MIVEKWKSHIFDYECTELKKKYRVGICQQITEFYSIWFNNFLVENLFKLKIMRHYSHVFYSKIMHKQKGFLSSHNKRFWILQQLTIKKKYFIVTLPDVEVKCILKHIQKYFI